MIVTAVSARAVAQRTPPTPQSVRAFSFVRCFGRCHVAGRDARRVGEEVTAFCHLPRVVMAVEELTEGVIARMLDSADGSTVEDPVCQVLSLKKLQTSNASVNVSERYRVVLSDGVHYAQGTSPYLRSHARDAAETVGGEPNA